MAQIQTTVADFFSVLLRSQLMPSEAVAILMKSWKGKSDDVQGVMKLLIAGKHLTEYQAVMLQRGHADGFQIGEYTIQNRINKGPSAGVYEALNEKAKRVAIKVLPASKAKKESTVKRFEREGRILKKLDHPHVVKALEHGLENGIHYIIMEFLDGESLEVILSKRQRLLVKESLHLTAQLLSALQHLHEHKIVHRDVKPGNLMIVGASKSSTLEANLKLLDIGLGRVISSNSSAELKSGDDSSNLYLTREGTILGTPDYLAPEQARDARTADIRSDIYSVGCCLFFMLTGRPPFQEKTVMAQMVKHATEPSPRLKEFLSELPVGLQEIVDCFLAKNPAERYQTPKEAMQIIAGFNV